MIFRTQIENRIIFPWMGKNKYDRAVNFDFETIHIKGEKEEDMYALFVDKKSPKTVLFFHGNGWALPYFYDYIEFISSLGYNVLAFEYPWFWESSGSPSKENIKKYNDVLYSAIKREKNIKEENTILWGYSIGSWIALDFAQNHSFEKIILSSPFSSLFAMSQKTFGFTLQKYLFLEDRYKNEELIKNIQTPLLIIHGNQDKLIPFSQGKSLFEKANSNEKYFLELEWAWHNGYISSFNKPLTWFIKEFLDWDYFPSHYYNIDTDSLSPKETKIKSIRNLDFYTDNSLTKFVSALVSFNEKSYIPKNLVSISWDYIADSKWNSLLRQEAKIALDKLGEAFFKEFWKKMLVVSAYRSYLYQQGIKNRGCPDNLCAKAWYSEHQSGLAVDFWETTTNEDFLANPTLKKYFLWLQENAYLYGFHNSYQKWLDIDSYEIEPWHWRYLGLELASYLKENNETFAEFYNDLNKK